MSSTVCAIVSTYNRSSMLKECLDSLISQTYPLHQIIVVNDGSTDDSSEVLYGYQEQIFVIERNNGGKSAALNEALTFCSSEYVWICDDDDIAEPDGLKQLVKTLDGDSTLDVVYGKHLLFKDDGHKRIYIEPYVYGRTAEKNIKLIQLEQNVIPQFSMLARKSIYDKVGSFREDLLRSQDYEMALRLVRNNSITHIQNIIFYCRQHQGPRGPKMDSFSFHEVEMKWLKYNKLIFEEIREKYGLDEFTPTFAASQSPPLKKRASLIQRGCIFALRAMWSEALEDFYLASTILDIPFSNEELELSDSTVNNDLSWNILGRDPLLIRKFHSIYINNDRGKELMFAVCRPIISRTRQLILEGKLNQSRCLVTTLLRLLGIQGAIIRSYKSLIK